MTYMAYLRIDSSRSYCSCDPKSSVDPTATGHYENYAPDYHKSKEPCGETWDYYISSYGLEYKEAAVPFYPDGV